MRATLRLCSVLGSGLVTVRSSTAHVSAPPGERGRAGPAGEGRARDDIVRGMFDTMVLDTDILRDGADPMRMVDPFDIHATAA